MSVFRYKMQNILNLKYKLEEQAKMDFAAARKKLDTEEEKLEELYHRREDYVEEGRKLRESSLPIQDILDNKTAILRMEDYIELQKINVSDAEKELENERVKMQEAIQERKIYEKLREKAFDNFIKEENAKESKEIDELTSYTYGQKKR